jgi:raffinose/stachyose/melibiose transport system permease protein
MTNRLLTQHGRSTTRLSVSTAAEYAIMIALVILFVGPLLIVVMSAFKTKTEILVDPLALPTEWRLDTFVRAWTVGRFSQYFTNTVIYTVATVAGTCLFASLAGYALSRLRFPGQNVVLLVFLVGLILPFQAIMIPVFYLLNDLNLLNSHVGTILVSTALALPFATFLMRAFFKNLPTDIAEAARLEGANEAAVFWRVMLPLALSGLATVAVFQFLVTWNAFLIPLITAPSESLRPMAVGLMFFSDRFSADRSLESAAIIIMNVPVLAAFVALQRYFIRGVASGTVRM